MCTWVLQGLKGDAAAPACGMGQVLCFNAVEHKLYNESVFVRQHPWLYSLFHPLSRVLLSMLSDGFSFRIAPVQHSCLQCWTHLGSRKKFPEFVSTLVPRRSSCLTSALWEVQCSAMPWEWLCCCNCSRRAITCCLPTCVSATYYYLGDAGRISIKMDKNVHLARERLWIVRAVCCTNTVVQPQKGLMGDQSVCSAAGLPWDCSV